jgi:hypothetical protein
MMQLTLFAQGEIARCPICCHEKHCGSQAILGVPEVFKGYTNRAITCLKCGATGTQSTNTEAA